MSHGVPVSTGNSVEREALRGLEEIIFDVIAKGSTPRQWAEWLQGPLEWAALQGNLDVVRKLVGAGAEIGVAAVHAGVGGGCEEIVTTLFENGAFADTKNFAGSAPIHVAASFGNAKMVQLLLRNGVDKDELGPRNSTPLSVAVAAGHVDVVRVLLNAGANTIIGFSVEGMTALNYAVALGKIDILRTLIEYGANVNDTNNAGATSLHVAAYTNNAEALNILVEAGGNLEALKHHLHQTPLHHAASRLCFEASHVLLKHGACVNAQDDNGATPLHLAAKRAGTEHAAKMVNLLLRQGADETAITTSGQTPAMMMRHNFEGGEGPQVEDDFEHVRELLQRAAGDRAWRRRGMMVLCRAHPGRMRLRKQKRPSQPRCLLGVASSTRSRARHARLATAGDAGGGDAHNSSSRNEVAGGKALEERDGGDWASLAARLIRHQEEGIFRTVVGYL